MEGINGSSITIDMISYDEFELKCLSKDDMLKRAAIKVASVYSATRSNCVRRHGIKTALWKSGDVNMDKK